MKRWVGPLIIAAVAAINLGAATADLRAAWPKSTWVAPVVIVDPSIPRCPTEDSTWCVWVGTEQGNGRGAITVNGPMR